MVTQKMKFQWRKRFFQKKETKDREEKQNSKGRQQRRLALIVGAVCIVVVGITGAWLVKRANIATLFTVSKPSTIAVKGPNGEEMAQLDLSYTDADKDENGKVTIKRVVSVVSDQPEHKIEIAHTTNLKGLSFEVHMATDVKKDASTGQYTYKISKEIGGDYLNQDKTINDYIGNEVSGEKNANCIVSDAAVLNIVGVPYTAIKGQTLYLSDFEAFNYNYSKDNANFTPERTIKVNGTKLGSDLSYNVTEEVGSELTVEYSAGGSTLVKKIKVISPKYIADYFLTDAEKSGTAEGVQFRLDDDIQVQTANPMYVTDSNGFEIKFSVNDGASG